MTFYMFHERILICKVAVEIHYITDFAFVIFHLNAIDYALYKKMNIQKFTK